MWSGPLAMSGLFFFQAEDGIRDLYVTGVQTCALPIWSRTTSRETGPMRRTAPRPCPARSEERRVGKSVDLGGGRIIKKKTVVTLEARDQEQLVDLGHGEQPPADADLDGLTDRDDR